MNDEPDDEQSESRPEPLKIVFDGRNSTSTLPLGVGFQTGQVARMVATLTMGAMGLLRLD
jgi:hypothetical protein